MMGSRLKEILSNNQKIEEIVTLVGLRVLEVWENDCMVFFNNIFKKLLLF